MPEFDEKIYKQYMINNDYSGLANYYQSLMGTVKKEDRPALRESIKVLRANAGKLNAFMQRADLQNDNKKLLQFKMQSDNGFYDIETEGSYAKQINDYIRNWGDKDATFVTYNFENEDDYNNFMQNIDIKKYNIMNNINPNNHFIAHFNGNPALILNKEALYKNPQILYDINKSLESNDFTTNHYRKFDDLIGLSELKGHDYKYYSISFGNKDDYNKYKIGKEHTLGRIFGNAFEAIQDYTQEVTTGPLRYDRRIFDIYDKANKLYDKIDTDLNLDFQGNEYVSTVIGGSYKSSYHKQLADGWANGLIKNEDYNLAEKMLIEQDINNILNPNFMNNNVYLVNADDGTSRKLGQEEITDYVKRLRANANIANIDKTFTYSMATNGGKIGTLINLLPSVDSKGKELEGDLKGGFSLFVEGGLEGNVAKNSINDDEMQYNIQLADHQKFNYPYNFLDGSHTESFERDNSANVIMPDGGFAHYNPDKLKIEMMNDIVMKQAIDFLQDNADYSSDGKVIKDDKYQKTAFLMTSNIVNHYFQIQGIDITNKEIYDALVESPEYKNQFAKTYDLILYTDYYE